MSLFRILHLCCFATFVGPFRSNLLWICFVRLLFHHPASGDWTRVIVSILLLLYKLVTVIDCFEMFFFLKTLIMAWLVQHLYRLATTGLFDRIVFFLFKQIVFYLFAFLSCSCTLFVACMFKIGSQIAIAFLVNPDLVLEFRWRVQWPLKISCRTVCWAELTFAHYVPCAFWFNYTKSDCHTSIWLSYDELTKLLVIGSFPTKITLKWRNHLNEFDVIFLAFLVHCEPPS